MKRAVITGITGQDGSYLAELLLEKGYEVHGFVRRDKELSPLGYERLSDCLDRLTLHGVDLGDADEVAFTIRAVRPEECYHLAAASFAAPTLETAYQVLTGNINATLFLLGALAGEAKDCRFFFAATSEMFGEATSSPQNEDTPFWPRSPYGISKLAGYHLVRNYRSLSGLHACSGILYNHESPRRGNAFVTQKIVRTAVAIKRGLATELRVGNTAARRDWGYAADYVRAMWLMLQQDVPEDLVIATQTTHTVAEFIEKTFARLGLDWRRHVVVDPQFYRPTETVSLCGDASRARRRLGWAPTIDFDGLVASMVDAELDRGVGLRS